MESGRIAKLQEQYTKCPLCGSDDADEGEMTFINRVLKRSCQCGYSIEIFTDEDGNIVKMTGIGLH